MTVAGDLHWERTQAGLYHTLYWANGYKYMVKNANAQWGPPNEWRVYYVWEKDFRRGKKEWKWLRRGYMSSHETLKAAKNAARQHNLHPREKWKFVCKVTNPNAARLQWYEKKYLGFYMYQQESRDGRLIDYNKQFLDPKSYSKEIDDKLDLCAFDNCMVVGNPEALAKHYLDDHNMPDLDAITISEAQESE